MSGDVTGQAGARIRVLDALRGIAILAVLAHHYLTRYAPPHHPYNLYGYATDYPRWLDLGARGVQFFFIISGFVIFMTLGRCRHLVEFWLRRLARLYPAYIVASAITLLVTASFGPPDFRRGLFDYLVGLTFLTPFVSSARLVEPAYWSLIVEIQFYFWISVIYATAGRRFIGAWAAFVGLGALLSVLGHIPGWHLLGSIARQVLLVDHVPYFTAGMIAFQAWSGRREGTRLWGAVALLAYAATAEHLSVPAALVDAGMLVLFLAFVRGQLEWLAIRPLLFVGGISYSLYLVHQYVGVSLIVLLAGPGRLPDLVAFAIATTLCLLLAYLLTWAVEGPGKRWIMRRAQGDLLDAVAQRLPRFAFAPRDFAARPRALQAVGDALVQEHEAAVAPHGVAAAETLSVRRG